MGGIHNETPARTMSALVANTPPSKAWPGVSSVATPSHRERDDGYNRVLVRLGPCWRVVLCRDGLQYISQRRYSEAPAWAWRGMGYSTSRSALIATYVSRQLVREDDHVLMGKLHALPVCARHAAAATP
jgi:hypothetical protein